MKTHSLWIEKYRPNSLDNFIGSEEVKTNIAKYLKNNDIPHLLFYGSAGTGKTSLAKLIVNNIKCDCRYLNASDENGIDTIREKVKTFAESATFNPIKVVILDEADFLTQPAQAALRNVIEEYSLTTRFILTCNNIEKIIEPLQSRCEDYKLVPPSKMDVFNILVGILTEEKVTFDNKDVAEVVKRFYPDVRKAVKNLQKGVNEDGIFSISQVDKGLCLSILEKLKSPKEKTWYEIRQLIANDPVDDYEFINRYLFDNLEEFSKGSDADLVITIDEYMWRGKVVPDKEINIMAMFGKILKNLNS